MPLIPLKIPAGVYRTGTDYEGSGRWQDANLVRWHGGSLRPVGGWQSRLDLSSRFTSAPRGMHTWIDNTADSYIAVASCNELYVASAGNTLYNITPHGFVKGVTNAAINTGFGGGYFSTGGSLYGKKQPSTGVFQEADSWSLDNWGEHLVGCSTGDGKLYEWDTDKTYGTDVIADGDFTAATGWTVGNNWSVTGGPAGVGLYQRRLLTIDASDPLVVDIATDTITSTAHGASDGDPLVYTVSSGVTLAGLPHTAIGGLTSGTTYYITNSTANTFQLAATQADALAGTPIITLTALGTGTTDTFEDQRHETLEQTVTTSYLDPYELRLTVNAVGANPSVDILIVGDNTSTVLLNQTVGAGTHYFHFDSDDISLTVSFKSTSATGDYFSLDDVSLKVPPHAAQIPNSPEDCAGLVVTEERFIFALQADANPRKVAWCDREDNTVWTAAATNEAGDFELQTNGEIMQAVRTRGATLIVTTTDAHLAVYQGPPYVYGFQRAGTACGTFSRHSVVPVDTGAFWMGKEAFFHFDGSVARQMPCDVLDFVFEDLNQNQISKVYGVNNAEYGEVWWFYPSAGSLECNRYVAYDYQENHWHIGEMDRTCGADQGVFDEPIYADATCELYNHELHGVAHGTSAPYAESGPISLGNGDSVMKVNQLIGDENTLGEVQVQFKTRFHPNDTSRTYPSATTYYSLTNMPTSVRFTGRQIRLRVEATGKEDFRVGVMRVNAEAGGRR
jgi:hypothetical protein